MCVLIFSTDFLILKKNSARYESKMYIDLRVKYLFLLSDSNETYIFSTDFRKIISNFMKMHPVGAE